MAKYDLIMDCDECNEYDVTQERVIEYANNRLDSNPDEKAYCKLPLNLNEAIRVIESFNEEVVAKTEANINGVLLQIKRIDDFYEVRSYDSHVGITDAPQEGIDLVCSLVALVEAYQKRGSR
jgi:hypothetical protein